MKASSRGCRCACGAEADSRPQAAKNGWLRRGTQVNAVWHCPTCKVAVLHQEEKELQASLKRLRPFFRTVGAIING